MSVCGLTFPPTACYQVIEGKISIYVVIVFRMEKFSPVVPSWSIVFPARSSMYVCGHGKISVHVISLTEVETYICGEEKECKHRCEFFFETKYTGLV